MRNTIGLTLMIVCLFSVHWTLTIAQQPDYMRREMREGEVRRDRPDQPSPEAEYLQKLDQQERELVDQLDQIHRQLERVESESPEAERLRRKADELVKRLDDVRAQLHERRSQPDIHRLERDVRKREEELQKLKRERPDSPRVRELREQIEQLHDKLASIRKRGEPDRPWVPPMDQELRIFPLEHMLAEYAAEIAEPFAGEDAVVMPDLRTNKLIVRAAPRFVDHVEEILAHIDQPPSPHREELMRREHDLGKIHFEHQRHRSNEEEERTLNLLIQPGDDGPQIFIHEERVSMGELKEKLQHIDVPSEWRIDVHVRGDISEEIIEDIVRLTTDMKFTEVEIERIKER